MLRPLHILADAYRFAAHAIHLSRAKIATGLTSSVDRALEGQRFKYANSFLRVRKKKFNIIFLHRLRVIGELGSPSRFLGYWFVPFIFIF